MAHLQYIPGDPRLVDQLVYELKSKGIFDQFRKDCIADVDTRPAYQNLRQRVENSVTTFLARQCWMPDLNKNQLREKLRKHILDGNYLEQGVERIVDQVVNPKVASVFIPQVEDLVYNYLGIARKKTTPAPETSNGNIDETSLLPTDLEAVSPGSVKSNIDKYEVTDIPEENKMEVEEPKEEIKDENTVVHDDKEKVDTQDSRLSGVSELTCHNSNVSVDIINIPLPNDDIKVENIPRPEKSPPDSENIQIDIDKIQLPADEPNNSMDIDIPLPEEASTEDKERFFKPVNSEDESSSDSSLIRNMSPLTPIRNFNNENSCDAQQAFENPSVDIQNDKKENSEPSSFRFTIETKIEDSIEAIKPEKQDSDPKNLSNQFANQVNINSFNTPMYEDSSNSNLLHIDYESDPNSKQNTENKIPDEEQHSTQIEVKKERKPDEKKSSHKSSSNRDTNSKDKDRRHSSSKDRRSENKPSSSKDNKSDRKSSKDDHKSSSKSSHKDRYHDRSDKKDSRDSSKHRSNSHKSSSHKDSKSHRSSSSSHRHSSSSKHSDEKKSSSHKDKTTKDEKYSKEKSSRDTKSSSSSHRSDKDKKSSSTSKSKHDDKDKKKSKKDTDDHYSASGRGSHSRRSTDRDSNDGSSSSKGSHNPSNTKLSDSKKSGKSTVSKSDTTSTNGDTTSPSDKDHIILATKTTNLVTIPQNKPIRVEFPILSPHRLPFVGGVKLRKPKIANNLAEAKKLMKMRKFLDEEQKRMNQEAALLLEFQANVRPSMSQVYSSIPGRELEFACIEATPSEVIVEKQDISSETIEEDATDRSDSISDILNAAEQVDHIDEPKNVDNDTEIIKLNHIDEPKKVDNDIEILKMNNEVDESNKDNTATVVIEDITNDGNSIEKVKKYHRKSILSEKVQSNKVKKQRNKLTIKKDMKKGLCEKIESNNKQVTTTEEDAEQANASNEVNNQSNITIANNNLNFEVTVITESVSDIENNINEEFKTDAEIKVSEDVNNVNESPVELKYFAEHEKYTAELERDRFSKFLKVFLDKNADKMFLINCDAYEESIFKEVSESFGTYNIVNCYKNGYLKLKNTVKNVNISSEIVLPVESDSTGTAKTDTNKISSPPFSPAKSECSFELGYEYVTKLEEMVNKTSRKEILEIILGSGVEDTSDIEMPTIDYCNESKIEDNLENPKTKPKRKLREMKSSENNNTEVPPPNKLRKLSGTDEISSTTEESEVTTNNNVTANNSFVRSKYLGKARRVGLPRPRRNNHANSPSSDKSIENYEQNTPVVQTPNGKISGQRSKVQRYDTSDLYKPKLHYLSRRNNIKQSMYKPPVPDKAQLLSEANIRWPIA